MAAGTKDNYGISYTRVLRSISAILKNNVLNIHNIFEIDILLSKIIFHLKMICAFIKLIENKKWNLEIVFNLYQLEKIYLKDNHINGLSQTDL